MIRRRTRGFTLLEVLIALAIVALSVGALLGAVTSSASNVSYIKDKTIAEWVALNRLTEMRIAQQMPQPGKRTGKTDMAGTRWQWESEVVELPVVKGMFRIDVHVRATTEAVDTKVPVQKPTAQTEPESTAAGSDLDDVAWATTVTGVVGSSRSAIRLPVAASYAGSPQSGGPGGTNNPGGTGNPNAPGNTNTSPGTTPGGPGFQPQPISPKPAPQER